MSKPTACDNNFFLTCSCLLPLAHPFVLVVDGRNLYLLANAVSLHCLACPHVQLNLDPH